MPSIAILRDIDWMSVLYESLAAWVKLNVRRVRLWMKSVTWQRRVEELLRGWWSSGDSRRGQGPPLLNLESGLPC
jgi:hypothetical protein